MNQWEYDIKGTSSNKPRKFWMITGDRNTPKVRHYDLQKAQKEAERLAQEHPGTEFFILSSVEMFHQPSGVNRVKL